MADITIKIASAKLVDLLETTRTYLNTLDMRLLTVGVTVDEDYVFSAGDEVVDGGYAPVNPTGFIAAVLDGTQAVVTGPDYTWTFDHDMGDFGVGAVVWTDPADGDAFVFGGNDADEPLIEAAGQTYTVRPRYTRRERP